MSQELLTSFKSNEAKGLLFTTICISLLGFFPATAVSVGLPRMQSDLGANISDIQWVLNSYTLVLSVFILISGSLSDTVGKRKILTIGQIIFFIGTILCGFSATVTQLIFFRVIQGIGAALVIPQSLAILNLSFDKSIRGQAIGLWSGFSGAVTILGPIIAGFFIDTFGWRSAFFILIPFSIVAFILTFKYISQTKQVLSKGIDYLGAALLTLALFLISLGLIQIDKGVDLNGLISIPSSIIILVGIILFFLFIFFEKRQKNPLINFSILNSSTIIFSNVYTLFLYILITVLSFYFPLYFQQLLGKSATFSSIGLLPLGITIPILTFFTGKMADRFGNRIVMVIGAFIVGIGELLLFFISDSYDFFGVVSLGLLIIGIGFGLFIPALSKAALSVSEEYSGLASGLNNFVSRFSGLIAIVVFGTILSLSFTNGLTQKVNELNITTEQKQEIILESNKILDINIPEFITDTQEFEKIIHSEFLNSLRLQFLILSILAFISSIVAYFYVKN